MFRSTLAALLLTCLVTAGFTPAACADDTVRLTYSCFFPPTHIQSQLAEQWSKEIEKRTNGKVVIDYFPGNTLTKAKQSYDGVVEGLSDIAMTAPAYSRGRFPVLAAIDLPMGYKTGVAATKVANGVVEKFHPAELDDVQVMYLHAHGPGLLFTREKPVKKLEDMKGLKIRATGNSAKVVKALGATPVAMSMPDSYQSLQKGVVDGSMYPMETNKGWKIGEVVDYGTETYPSAYTTTFFVVMNKDKWNALPDDVKATITEINKEWSGKHGKAWDESDVAGREFFLEKGNTFIPLSEEEGARWKAAATPIIDEYAVEIEGKGLPGKEVVKYISETLDTVQ